MRSLCTAARSSPCLPQLEKARMQQGDLAKKERKKDWEFPKPGGNLERWCCESAALNMPANLENSAMATGLKTSVFIPIPKKVNAKECSNYRTIPLIRRKWQPTPVFLPGESQGWGSPVGCSPWGHKESDTTEQLHFHFVRPYIFFFWYYVRLK